MTAVTTHRQLRRLAHLRGVQLSYTRHDGRVVRASAETLTGVLDALGHPVPNATAISDQLRLAEEEHRRGAGRPRGLGHRAARSLPRPRRTDRQLAVSAPLYAIRGRDDWGIGSFTDLGTFAELARSWGADLVGTLPLFAISTEAPIDPSPYLPLSRLFWNELYVDVAHAAGLAGTDAPVTMRPEARARRASETDYESVASAKRRALEVCAVAMEAVEGRRRDDFEQFVAAQPSLAAYADFRAKGDEQVARYHRFVQYAAATQLAEAAAGGDPNGVGLYLDLPVGVHPDGFDTHAFPDLFADAQVGAPPDPLAESGQAWGFPPLHPQRLQASDYRYIIDSLRVALRYARAIRIDHILGLQRLYWIPRGLDATAGAYVRYPYEELLTIVALEAARVGAVVVGEDLGTVSREVGPAMDRYGILHSFEYRFEASPERPLPQPRRPSAASVGSHDLPRFATYWSDPDQQELARAVGVADPAAALQTCLESLAAGPAAVVVVDVADLEGETEPDNRPGTGPEAGNWRRRLPRSLDELATDDSLRIRMSRLAEARDAKPSSRNKEVRER